MSGLLDGKVAIVTGSGRGRAGDAARSLKSTILNGVRGWTVFQQLDLLR